MCVCLGRGGGPVAFSDEMNAFKAISSKILVTPRAFMNLSCSFLVRISCSEFMVHVASILSAYFANCAPSNNRILFPVHPDKCLGIALPLSTYTHTRKRGDLGSERETIRHTHDDVKGVLTSRSMRNVRVHSCQRVCVHVCVCVDMCFGGVSGVPDLTYEM